MFDLAILWLVIVSTGSPFFVGVVSGALYAAQILFGLFAGVYADRFNRRDLLIVINVFEGIIVGFVGFLYASGYLNFSVLLVAVVMIYGLAIVTRTSVNALIPSIVQESELAATNGMFSLTSSFNTFLNFAVGGLVIAAIGVGLPITYDSLTFFFAAFSALFIVRTYGNPARTMSSNRPTRRVGNDLVEGLSYLRSSRFLLQVLLFGSVVNFFGTGAITLLSPYSRLWIGGGPDTYGFLLAAFSIGGILASTIFGKLDLRNYAGKILVTGITAVGLIVVSMGFVRSADWAITFSFLFGFSVVFANLPIQVLLQAKIPREMIGRVYATLTTAVSIAQPLAAISAGIFASEVPIGPVFATFGVGIIAFSTFAFGFLGELRADKY